MNTDYHQLHGICTIKQAIWHPLAKRYRVYSTNLQEAIDLLNDLCIQKGFGPVQIVPGTENNDIPLYYCGYIKIPFITHRDKFMPYNRVFLGWSEKTKRYKAFLWWSPMTKTAPYGKENGVIFI